jgi:glycosyltransferase involved in cell wall biosynthesis
VIPGEHYVLANSGPEMSAAVIELAQNPERAARLCGAGQEIVRRQYDWAILGDRLAEHLLKLVSKRATLSSA